MTRHLTLAACCLALAACSDQRDPVAAITPSGEPSLAAAGIVPTDKAGTPITLPTYDPADIVPGRYNVIYRQDANARAVTAQIMNAHGLKPSHRWDEAWIKGFSAQMTDKQRDQLKRHPQVAFVNPVVRGKLGGTLYYPFNWGLDRIDQRNLPLDNAYTYTDSAPNVNVYVLDTGIRRTHNDFGGRALFGYDAVTSGGTANDCHGHGTFVAAIIGGTEYGVAKRARLYAVRTADCAGGVTSADAIEAVNWVTNNHSKPAVANISWYFHGVVPEVDQAIYASIQAGVTYVVLAGNDGVDACNITPAHTLNTITVGATDRNDARPTWSDFGPCLNLFAPGVDIESAGIADDYAYRVDSGTSFAAPHVAGIAANYLGRVPTATPSIVKSAIVNNATSGVVTNAGTGSPNKLAWSRF
ncbi:MAG TPA: S8 family serine peptidase [Longimicrobium sp.]|nr:S8 family serine peptidase [Longimicrobium sp.]